jgi:hypothetical protein
MDPVERRGQIIWYDILSSYLYDTLIASQGSSMRLCKSIYSITTVVPRFLQLLRTIHSHSGRKLCNAAHKTCDSPILYHQFTLAVHIVVLVVVLMPTASLINMLNN